MSKMLSSLRSAILFMLRYTDKCAVQDYVNSLVLNFVDTKGSLNIAYFHKMFPLYDCKCSEDAQTDLIFAKKLVN